MSRIPPMIRRLLEPYNPWWHDPNWYRYDPLITAYEESVLKRKPRLFHHFRRYLVYRGYYGIITVRGPRRVGKSTLIKLLIRYLIEEKSIDPHNIFYVSLDYEGLSNIPLVEIIKAIAESSNEEKYVFLDEVSMHPRWAQALKNAYDLGLINKGKLKIIATGSHSMDLAEAASKLRDRQGKLASLFNVGGNLVQPPLRFPEIVEGLRDEIGEFFSRHKLRTPRKRFELLQELSSGRIPTTLKYIYDNYFQLIQHVFEGYLLHGGYPRAIDEYYKSNRIPAEFYSDVANLLITDSAKAGLDPENLKRVLEFLLEPKRLSGLLDLEKAPIIGRDSEGRPKGKFGLKDYLDYLRTTWCFFFPYPEEGKSGSCIPNYREKRKVYVLDPFIYHALYSYIINNIPDPFTKSQEMVKNTSFRGQLIESVIASHLLLSQQLFEHVPDVNYDRVLMYRRVNSEGEIDFILCITKAGTHYRFVIESKYRRTPTHITPMKGKIILTKDILDVRKEMTYIPVSLFLLLF